MKQPSSKIFDRLAPGYTASELQPAEFHLLSAFRTSLHRMDVLDLGGGKASACVSFARTPQTSKCWGLESLISFFFPTTELIVLLENTGFVFFEK